MGGRGVSDRTLVVVGASLAGLRAVEAARRLGHEGPLVLVGGEEHLPYDRPPLSKAVLAASDAEPADPTHAASHRLADELDVDLRLSTWATGLDVAGRCLHTDGGDVAYDELVVATGSHARPLPGTEHLAGAHRLRTLEDARAIRAALEAGARTVVVGAGLIGSEIASAARTRGLDTTVVEAAEVPLVRAVGPDVGALLPALHTDAGTHLHLGTGVEEVLGEDGHVTGVRLSDGTGVPCDLLVVGIGAAPAVGWLEGSGLDVSDGVACDATLRAAPGVWAAGDVARWPNEQLGGRVGRLETWTSAAEQGVHAARNAVDPDGARPYTTVPYFWSDWYGRKLQHVGVPDAPHVEVLRADDGGLVALYADDDDALRGAFTLDRPGLTHKLRRMLMTGGSYADARDLVASKL